MEGFREYWFYNYYRAVLVSSGDVIVVSIDVYRRSWVFNDYRMICVKDNEYCLLYAELKDGLDKYVLDNGVVDRVVVTGVKARDVYETINVKWFVKGVLNDSDVEKLFKYSWMIIGCSVPTGSLNDKLCL